MKSLLTYVIVFVVAVSGIALAIGFFFTPAVGAAPATMPAIAAVEGGEEAGFRGWFVQLEDGTRWHARASIYSDTPVVGRVRSVEVFSKCFTAGNWCAVTHAEITDNAGNTFTAYPAEAK